MSTDTTLTALSALGILQSAALILLGKTILTMLKLGHTENLTALRDDVDELGRDVHALRINMKDALGREDLA